MIKIILSKDPIYSVKEKGDAQQWTSSDLGTNFDNLIDLVKTSRSISFPYAEKLFVNDALTLTFISAARNSNCDISLYCKDLDNLSLLQQYSSLVIEKNDLSMFKSDFDALGFSKMITSVIIENCAGISYSTIEQMLITLKGTNENEALEYVLDFKRTILKQSDILEVVTIDEDISGIGGLEELKEWIVSRRDNFSENAKEFGIPVPKGVLLLGVQGCGKSLTAKIISNIWKFPLVRLDFINLFKKGSSVEELMREAMSIAESFSPVVLWIDEIEKALFQEDQANEIRRVLGWLMTWMQEKTKNVFLVATANQVKILPPELLRKGRFDEIFFIDLPTPSERSDIFSIHIEKAKRTKSDFNISKLTKATDGFSGAEIEQVIIDALTADFSRSRELNQKSIEESIRKTVPLSVTYQENIKELRLWSKNRARSASGNKKIESFFS